MSWWLTEPIRLVQTNLREIDIDLEDELGVPVLDGVVCATKQAEVLVELGKKTSKLKTYRPPEQKRFDGIFSNFSTDGSADKKQAAAE